MLEFIGAPYDKLLYRESQTQVLTFCSLCSLIMNKKQDYQHIFGLLIDEAGYKNILGEMLDSSDDTESLKTFLMYDTEESVVKSKYVAKLVKGLR